MAHRRLLTDEERRALLGVPFDADSMARCFTLSRADQNLVAERAGMPIGSALLCSSPCFAIPGSLWRTWSSPSSRLFNGWPSSSRSRPHRLPITHVARRR